MADRTWIPALLGAEPFARLAEELPGTALQSVLLEVMERRARARRPAEVLAQYARDPFCAPAPVDQRTLVALDAALLGAAEGFEAVELSPVAPLGTCSAVAATGQRRVLSALRATEVVSDPTNVLALELARRLGREGGPAVHLATSQRVVRAQAVPRVAGYAQHFRLFALASGGPEEAEHGFTARTVALHVRTMLRALDAAQAAGYAVGPRRVDVLATPARSALGDHLAGELGPDAPTARAALAHAYYSGGLRCMIWAAAPDGVEFPIADVGAFDWLATLTTNRRAVFVASGLGAQLLPARFRR